jgi:2-aminoadipate transaminase
VLPPLRRRAGVGADRCRRRAGRQARKALIAEHKPKFVYLIPTFGNPSGALLSLERRKKILELAVKYQVLIVEDDPYGDLYFTPGPPPPSMLA